MTTPMMQQYEAIKAQVPGAILFFRLGDFYEMFGKDAELAASILEIALTGRDAGEGQRVPMCGVPYHAADNYISKLVAAGYKVAICEQVEDPKSAKGIVKREVVRIVSPGTQITNLVEDCANFLASVCFDHLWGLAYVDVSTGEFGIFQTERMDILTTELSRLQPAELLLPPELAKKGKWLGYFITIRGKDTYESSALSEHFSAQKETFTEFPVAAKAANALWVYLQETMPGVDPAHIIEVKTYRQEQTMVLDQWTRRNLELTEPLRGQGKKGTLLSVLDLTKTAFGGRMLRQWLTQPLLRKEEIEKRLDIVEALVMDGFLREDLTKLLGGVYDLERLMGKVSYGHANAKDLLAITYTLNRLPPIRSVLATSTCPDLLEYITRLDGLDEIASELEQALNPEAPATLKEGNLIKSGYSKEIDGLRSVASGGKEWVAQLEARERERTGIRSLKIGYNKIFGYYIEVTRANSHLVPGDYQRKQTLANAERFVTPELKEYEQKILGAEDRLMELEYELFIELRELVRSRTKDILRAARALAEIDVFLSLAEVAVRYRYVRPKIQDNGVLEIIEGRHPVIEQMLEPGQFVPNDTYLLPAKHLAIITGPNMAGKSTYMRQVALITLMAHIGSFVPAEKANISLVDRIFTRVGASDDLASGQSTFMVEMREVAHILNNMTEKSLVILDEIGRGTATFDGLSIAWAVAEYMASEPARQAKTLFATHYHELTQLQESFPGIFNLHVGVREHGDDIVFLHKILPGRSDRSYGIQVARLAGLPAKLLTRAKELLHNLETSETTTSLESRTPAQLSLFEAPQTHPLFEEILGLDIDEMTPKQALEYLYEIRDRVKALQTF